MVVVGRRCGGVRGCGYDECGSGPSRLMLAGWITATNKARHHSHSLQTSLLACPVQQLPQWFRAIPCLFQPRQMYSSFKMNEKQQGLKYARFMKSRLQQSIDQVIMQPAGTTLPGYTTCAACQSPLTAQLSPCRTWSPSGNAAHRHQRRQQLEATVTLVCEMRARNDPGVRPGSTAAGNEQQC